MSPFKLTLHSIVALVFLVLSGEARANLVLNGDFSSFTTGANGQGQLGTYTTVADWTSGLNESNSAATNLLYQANTSEMNGSYNPGNNDYYTLWGPKNGSANGFTDESPTGSGFVGLDGDVLYRGALSQTITGLVKGYSYALNFNWAGTEQTGYSGTTYDTMGVTFGSDTQSTDTVTNAAKGFTGWMNQTMIFTASGTSETLSFLASSTPSGLPPYLLLADVSLNVVPEPSSMALLSGGLLAIVGVGVRRRAARNRNV